MTLDVSRETAQRLEIFRDLILKWNGAINLVGRAEPEKLVSRHIDDSLQIAKLTKVPRVHADVGSGGGFPAIPLAIVWSKLGVVHHLIEADKRKAVFLRRAIAELGLASVTVHDDRIEALPPLGADLLTARALAPLDRLLAYVDRHMAPGGKAILPKGRTWMSEVEAAKKIWNFKVEPVASETDPQSAILKVWNVAHHAA